MDEYERDKLFFVSMTHGLPPEWAATTGIPPDSARLALEALEAAPKRIRRKLLKELVGMLVQSTSDWPADVVRQLDEQLAARGATTLGAFRLRHSRKLVSIERRGVIRNEEEAYLVKDILDGPMEAISPERFARLQAMFDAFELTITHDA